MKFSNIQLEQEELDSAFDQQIIQGCLVLKQESYQDSQFMERTDIIYVYAPKLRVAA